MICPVIQELAGFNKNVARLATSSDWPTRPKGCLFHQLRFSPENLVRLQLRRCVNEGAMAFTLILLAANSAANDPS
jgi:hypothetical protein